MPTVRPIAILFDLDGTLIDTIELLLSSVRHAFRGRTERVPTEAEWVAGIGTPLVTQLRPYAATEAELGTLVEGYRSYQREHHDRLTRCYGGVLETVTRLRDQGHPLGVVTSKGDEIASRSLAHVGLAPLMDTVVGCDSCTRHKPDPEPVLVALDRLGYGPEEALFLGDSPHDMASGNAAGVITVAALWGPFTRAMLEPTAPDYYLDRIEELPALVEGVERRPGRRAGRRMPGPPAA
jgi:pyrophosphatase PpaX